MQIRTGRNLFGVDGALLRSFLLTHPDDFTREQFRLSTLLSEESATMAIHALAGEGFVRSFDGGETYVPDDRAYMVTEAHPGGTYKRSMLAEEMTSLVSRIVQANARASKTLFFIAKLSIYGSYQTGTGRTVGDLDLAVEWRYLFQGEPVEARAGRVLRRAAELGQAFDPDEWPLAEAFLRGKCEAHLRGGSPWIDVEPFHEVLRWDPDRMAVLVDADDPEDKGKAIRDLLEEAREGHALRYAA